MLTAELHANLSAVLRTAGPERDARALPVPGLVALAAALASSNSLRIDFASVEQLGQPRVVLSVTSAPRSGRFDALTPREREVADCVASGLPNRTAIAAAWQREYQSINS